MIDDEIVQAAKKTPELPEVATLAEMEEAERAIGHRLPQLLRRLYLEVGNGGFGPRDGVFGVSGDDYDFGDWANIVETYTAFSTNPADIPGLVWFFDWGCATWSIVDCRTPDAQMYGWDPNDSKPYLFRQNMTLSEWLIESLNGNLAKAFELSSLRAISERRERFDDDLEIDIIDRSMDPISDQEIVSNAARTSDASAPANAGSITAMEIRTGLTLPPLLRSLYTEVANGGFGPGNGILPIPTIPYEIDSIENQYKIFSQGDNPLGPPGLMWLCEWDCGIWSLVDCRDPTGPMWGWDPLGPYLTSNESQRLTGDSSPLFRQNMTLADWLTHWINGDFDAGFRPSALRMLADRLGS